MRFPVVFGLPHVAAQNSCIFLVTGRKRAGQEHHGPLGQIQKEAQ
jgi:hypothetical protein